MAYEPIEVDRERLTIMGVAFPDLGMLEDVASAIGSQMFEGYEPTPRRIEIARDYMIDKITLAESIKLLKDDMYAKSQ